MPALSPSAPSTARTLHILNPDVWLKRARRHRERIQPWTEAYRTRASSRHPHPVYDFLFSYYSFRPAQLETWHPGFETALAFNKKKQIQPYLRSSKYSTTNSNTVLADPATLTHPQIKRFHWILSLLKKTSLAPPHFRCFGLHEWAMVYHITAAERRHHQFRLRLTEKEIAYVIEHHSLSCTHFDAFRFFAPSASRRNRHQPTLDSRLSLEQPACIHTNMDLYKWAYKLTPWIPGELLADSFELATIAREIDMRASPYDLTDLGFQPITIETSEGKKAYEAQQRELAEAAALIRDRLISRLNRLLTTVSG
ncbi:MAG: 3-methyladenine DNA glycosylase [Verrucomicrobiota bacterium]